MGLLGSISSIAYMVEDVFNLFLEGRTFHNDKYGFDVSAFEMPNYGQTDNVVSNNDPEPTIEDSVLLGMDVLYAGNKDTDMRKNVKENLNGEETWTDDLTPDLLEENEDGDLMIDGIPAEYFEGKTVFYRPKMFFSGLSESRSSEVKKYISRLDDEYGFQFINNSEAAEISDNKEKTKEVLGKNGVDVVESYDDFDEVTEALNRGETVVSKPNKGSCGEGIRFIESVEEFEFDEDLIYEEFVDHYSGSGEDRRAFLAGGKLLEVQERALDTDSLSPKNIANGGEYKDVEDISYSELENILKSSSVLDDGVLAIDYIRTDEGEVKVLEANSTPGTKINEVSETDIYEEVSDYISSVANDGSYEGGVSEHLEDKLERFNETELEIDDPLDDSSQYSSAPAGA